MWTGVCCGGRCRSTPPWVWLRLPSPVLGSLRAAGSTARLVFLTVHDEEELILAARNAGAIGYVLKSRLSADLEVAVREARAGRPFQSSLDS